MIVSVCLSKGALAMARKKVIVKRLNSIQNFGAMDVLCTDKTGTLTRDHVILEIYCDVFKKESDAVLLDAYLISHFQTGLKNVLDRAVLSHPEAQQKLCIDNYRKVDEIPFDFSRKMMSVIVETPEHEYHILTKGAPEAVFAHCTQFESEGEILPMEPILIGDLIQEYNDLSADGFRVLAVASAQAGQTRRLLQSRRIGTDSQGLHRLPRSAQGNRRPGHRRLAAQRRRPSKCSPATTTWSRAKSAKTSAWTPAKCCWAARSKT